LRRRDLAIATVLAAAVATTLIGVAIFGKGQPQPRQSDAEAPIGELARRSVEVLPAGEWPSLYDSFTMEYQQRCPRAEFEQAGIASAEQLGASLSLLQFLRLEELSVTADVAGATIVGQIEGQNEYRVRAAFKIEEGEWKLAPAANTTGCNAFDRIEG